MEKNKRNYHIKIWSRGVGRLRINIWLGTKVKILNK